MSYLLKPVIRPILNLKPAKACFKEAEKKGTAWYFFQLYLRGQKPIIVYQMGKVGSDSISKSLQEYGIRPVYHIHYIHPANRQAIRDDLKRRNQPVAGRETIINLYKNVTKKGKPAKFITLVRDPITRNISAFFQNFAVFTGVKYEQANFTTTELIDIFMREYPHDVPITWFDKELKPTLGIDIFQYPFSKEKGYISLKQDNFDLLILKTETEDAVKAQAIAEFLDLNNFTVARTNVSQDKDYAHAYRRFTQSIVLPRTYINDMCNNKYTRHFYNGAEIETIRTKWER